MAGKREYAREYADGGGREYADDEEGFGNKLKGVGEAALSLGTGLLSVPITGLNTLGGLAMGNSLDDSITRANKFAQDDLIYKPETKTGKGISDSVNQTIQDAAEAYGQAYGKERADVNKEKFKNNTVTAADYRAEAAETSFGGALGFFPPVARLRGAKPAPRGTIDVDRALGSSSAVDRPPPLTPPEVMDRLQKAPTPIESEVSRLHDADITQRLTDIDTDINQGPSRQHEIRFGERPIRDQMDLPFNEPPPPFTKQLDLPLNPRSPEPPGGLREPPTGTPEGGYPDDLGSFRRFMDDERGSFDVDRLKQVLGGMSEAMHLWAQNRKLFTKTAEGFKPIGSQQEVASAPKGSLFVEPAPKIQRPNRAKTEQQNEARRELFKETENGEPFAKYASVGKIEEAGARPISIKEAEALLGSGKEIWGSLAGKVGTRLSEADLHVFTDKRWETFRKQPKFYVFDAPSQSRPEFARPFKIVETPADFEAKRAVGFPFKKFLKDEEGSFNIDRAKDLFHKLADQQRGKPESAMLRAAGVLGKYPSGNLYGSLLEHVGDLTHRMSEKTATSGNFGKEFVREKVERALRWLENPTDRQRMGEIPMLPELKAYAEAHKELPYYNIPQKLARDAAVALGEKRFDVAEANLHILKRALDSGMWEHKAGVAKKSQRGGLNFNAFAKESTDLTRGMLDLVPKAGEKIVDWDGNHYTIEKITFQLDEHGDYANIKANVSDPRGTLKVLDETSSPELSTFANILEELKEEPSNNKMFRFNENRKGPGRYQRGNLLIDPNDARKGDWLANQAHLKLPGIAVTKWTLEQATDAARAGTDIKQNMAQKAFNLLTKGGLFMNIKLDNPLFRYGQERFQEADRGYRAEIENLIHGENGLAPLSRNLSDHEAVQITRAMDRADMMQIALTEQGLRDAGATDAQVAYWKRHSEVMKTAFDRINEARHMAGLAAIDPRVGYAAMRSTGDFKRLVFDNNGPDKKIVGIVGSNFRVKLNAIAKALEGHGFFVGEERHWGSFGKEKGQVEAELMRTLEALADRDGRVMDFMTTLDELMRSEAYSMLNMKKHTLTKKGIFGMEGRKTEDYLTRSTPDKLAEMNANDFLGAQLVYAENAMKYGHMAKAIEEVSPLLKDPSINMPVAKQLLRNYADHAMGYNPTAMGQGIDKVVKAFLEPAGIGTSAARALVANTRQVVNASILGLNPLFWLTNVVQPFKSMPGMMAYLVSKGLSKDFDFGTGYKYMTKAVLTELRDPANLSPVERGARQYTKENYVYGTSMVEHSNRPRNDWINKLTGASNLAIGPIESGTRRIVFNSFIHMLYENGMPVDKSLYQTAHNLTDMTMNNYSRLERPMVYDHLGLLGEAASNLQSFKHNELSRIALFGRELAQEKKARPALVELISTVAFAGIRGIPAFAAFAWLYNQLTSYLNKPDDLNLRVIQASEDMAKAAKAKGADHVLSHGLFSLLGGDMSNRIGMGNLTGTTAADVFFPAVSKAGAMIGSTWDAGAHPSEMNTKRMIREFTPNIGTGIEDLAWFSKPYANEEGKVQPGRLGNSRKTLEAQAARTDADVAWKLIGGTGINESVSKDKLHAVEQITQAYADKRNDLIKKARDQFYATGTVEKQVAQDYMKNEGNINAYIAAVTRMARNQSMPKLTRKILDDSVSNSITKLREAKRLEEAYGLRELLEQRGR